MPQRPWTKKSDTCQAIAARPYQISPLSLTVYYYMNIDHDWQALNPLRDASLYIRYSSPPDYPFNVDTKENIKEIYTTGVHQVHLPLTYAFEIFSESNQTYWFSFMMHAIITPHLFCLQSEEMNTVLITFYILQCHSVPMFHRLSNIYANVDSEEYYHISIQQSSKSSSEEDCQSLEYVEIAEADETYGLATTYMWINISMLDWVTTKRRIKIQIKQQKLHSGCYVVDIWRYYGRPFIPKYMGFSKSSHLQEKLTFYRSR